jgi:nucleotide-binding universal stress UspA family protein
MRVLLATDGSEAAGVGIKLARSASWPEETTVRVITAVETGRALYAGPWPAAAALSGPQFEAELRESAQEIVEAAAANLRVGGLAVEHAVVEGRPSAMIVAEAERFGADLVIVGARGHGRIESMLLGSVSAEVLDAVRVPLLIARDPGLQRVIIASDRSGSAAEGARTFQAWSIFRGKAVRVVTVSELPATWWAGVGPEAVSALAIPSYLDALDSIRATDESHANDLAAELRTAGFDADAEVRVGDPATEVLAVADEWKANLIVMGTHGRTGLARLALGSVARNVVHHARASVLVVRGSDSA